MLFAWKHLPKIDFINFWRNDYVSLELKLPATVRIFGTIFEPRYIFGAKTLDQ